MNENDINPRYLIYCKAHELTYEEMLRLDEERYPGGVMAGFMLWVHGKIREWKNEVNYKGDHLSIDQLVQFDKWLMKEKP